MSHPQRTTCDPRRQRNPRGEKVRETTRLQITYRRGVYGDGALWVEVDVEPLLALVRLVSAAVYDAVAASAAAHGSGSRR